MQFQQYFRDHLNFMPPAVKTGLFVASFLTCTFCIGIKSLCDAILDLSPWNCEAMASFRGYNESFLHTMQELSHTRIYYWQNKDEWHPCTTLIFRITIQLYSLLSLFVSVPKIFWNLTSNRVILFNSDISTILKKYWSYIVVVKLLCVDAVLPMLLFLSI